MVAGSTFTVRWPEYQCPSGGDGALSGYKPQVSGAASYTPAAGDFLSRTIQVTAGTQPITVKYRAYCGQRNTPYSSSLKITVQAPSAPPTPTTPDEPAPSDSPSADTDDDLPQLRPGN